MGRLVSKRVMSGSICFLISDMTLEGLLIMVHLLAPFPPRPAQFAEPDVLHLWVFGSSPRCRVEFGLFCSVTQIKLFRTCAGVRESQVCFRGMYYYLVFRDMIHVSV